MALRHYDPVHWTEREIQCIVTVIPGDIGRAASRKEARGHAASRHGAASGYPGGTPGAQRHGGGGRRAAREVAVEEGHQLIKLYRASTSPQPTDYTHLSQLSVRYALFGLWQSSEDQDQSGPATSFQIWQRVGQWAPGCFQTAGQTIPLCPHRSYCELQHRIIKQATRKRSGTSGNERC